MPDALRTPAELAKEVHRQFTVLRAGRTAVAEYAKSLGDVYVLPLVDGPSDEPLGVSSPAEVSSRLVDAIFGRSKPRHEPASVPVPVPAAKPATWEEWQAAQGE